MPRFPLVVALILLAGCGAAGEDGKGAAGGGHGGPGGMPPPAQVTAVTVERRTLPVTFEYVGQTVGSREVEVRARVSGILLKRNFVEGEPVRQGQSLYTIDPAPFEAAYARAEADVAAAKARYEQAQRNAARLKPLLGEKAISQKEHDDALSAEAIGAADFKAAQARLVEAKLALGYTRVEAPASGITGRSLRSEGSLIAGPEALLTTVTQVDPMWVSFGIPDNEQAGMQKEAKSGALALPKGGQFEVQLRLPDGTVYGRQGRVNFSAVRIDPGTGTREFRAALPNPEGALRPGQFVRVVLRGATRPDAVTVPQRAVLEGPQGKFVYVIDDKGTAQPRPVVAGDWSQDAWLIRSGLEGGERVIVDGVMKIGPGAPVRVAAPADGDKGERVKPGMASK